MGRGSWRALRWASLKHLRAASLKSRYRGRNEGGIFLLALHGAFGSNTFAVKGRGQDARGRIGPAMLPGTTWPKWSRVGTRTTRHSGSRWAGGEPHGSVRRWLVGSDAGRSSHQGRSGEVRPPGGGMDRPRRGYRDNQTNPQGFGGSGFVPPLTKLKRRFSIYTYGSAGRKTQNPKPRERRLTRPTVVPSCVRACPCACAPRAYWV
jgi:hypothetical protein